ELYLVSRFQKIQVGPKVVFALPAIGAFQIHDYMDPWIHTLNGNEPAGFQKNRLSHVSEHFHQGECFFLYKRLSAREFNEWAREGFHPPEHLGYLLEVSFLERVRGVTPRATCRASSETHEHTRKSSKGGFTLDAPIDLVHEETSLRFFLQR